MQTMSTRLQLQLLYNRAFIPIDSYLNAGIIVVKFAAIHEFFSSPQFLRKKANSLVLTRESNRVGRHTGIVLLANSQNDTCPADIFRESFARGNHYLFVVANGHKVLNRITAI